MKRCPLLGTSQSRFKVTEALATSDWSRWAAQAALCFVLLQDFWKTEVPVQLRNDSPTAVNIWHSHSCTMHLATSMANSTYLQGRGWLLHRLMVPSDQIRKWLADGSGDAMKPGSTSPGQPDRTQEQLSSPPPISAVLRSSPFLAFARTAHQPNVRTFTVSANIAAFQARCLEHMPLLGAFVIAGDRISDHMGDFEIYNITLGIHTSRVSPWLGRLLLSQAQSFHPNDTVLRWTIERKKPNFWERALPVLVAIFSCMPLLVLAILADDGWDVANAAAILISILVRAHIVQAHKQAIDSRVAEASTTYKDGLPFKCLLVAQEGHHITMVVPTCLMVPVSPLISLLSPPHRLVFDVVKFSGWVAFAVHVISIGMSCLMVQLYTVCLLVIPTILLILRFGCPDSSALGTITWNWRSTNKCGQQ